MLWRRSALAASQHNRCSHESEEEVDTSVRIWTRWRKIGERIGRSAGGGRGDTKAVGRQARRGGSNVRGSGGGISSTIVKSLSGERKGEEEKKAGDPREE
jgi:hypothetical protein